MDYRTLSLVPIAFILGMYCSLSLLFKILVVVPLLAMAAGAIYIYIKWICHWDRVEVFVAKTFSRTLTSIMKVNVTISSIKIRRKGTWGLQFDIHNLVIENPEVEGLTWESPYFLRLKKGTSTVGAEGLLDTFIFLVQPGGPPRFCPHRMLTFGFNTKAMDELTLTGLRVNSQKKKNISNTECMDLFNTW